MTIPDRSSRKNVLLGRVLPELKGMSSFFSLVAVKRFLSDRDIQLADGTLREYMSEAMAAGIVTNAGRGWYSRHTELVSLDPDPVVNIIRTVDKSFPLLDFCCWSTIQFNAFAQHLIGRPTLMLYTESDALETVAENLREVGWNAWVNPGQKDVERFVRPGENTVILRPAISKQPAAANHAAPIEKALVDLMVESARLKLMDDNEVQRIVDAVLQGGMVQLSTIIGYAEIRGLNVKSREITY